MFRKHPIVLVAILAAIFSSFFPQHVYAAGWYGCSWGASTPVETTTHDLRTTVSFSCSSSGTRQVKGELWIDNFGYPDTFLERRVITFTSSSGAFTVTETACEDRRVNQVFYGRSWMINPDSGSQSSDHQSDRTTAPSLACPV